MQRATENTGVTWSGANGVLMTGTITPVFTGVLDAEILALGDHA